MQERFLNPYPAPYRSRFCNAIAHFAGSMLRTLTLTLSQRERKYPVAIAPGTDFIAKANLECGNLLPL
jgi:hypothetical protein